MDASFTPGDHSSRKSFSEVESGSKSQVHTFDDGRESLNTGTAFVREALRRKVVRGVSAVFPRRVASLGRKGGDRNNFRARRANALRFGVFT